MQPLDVVLFGRCVAPALLREHVHHDRPVPLGGVGKGRLHEVDVVTVDRARVAHPERLEEGVRGDHLAQRGGDGMHAGHGQRPECGNAAEPVPQPFARVRVRRD